MGKRNSCGSRWLLCGLLLWLVWPGPLVSAQVFRLDFGPTDSPVWAGFGRVTPADPALSSAGRLRGFAGAVPDDLAGDGIVAEKGDFCLSLSLTNGTYQVWLLSGDSAEDTGASGILHLGCEVKVTANGREVMRRQRSLWYAQDFDYSPTADVWERYAGTNRFMEATFEVTVKNGQLRLCFGGQNNQRHDYAFPLNAVMIYPAGLREQMDLTLASIRTSRRDQWKRRFPQVPWPWEGQAWEPTAAENNHGYVAWWQSYLDKVYPNTTPPKVAASTSATTFATPGESEPLSVGIRAVRDLQAVAIQVGDLHGPAGSSFSRSHVVPYLVRYNEKVSRPRMWQAAEPFALVPWRDIDIPAGVTRQCWLKFQVPTNAIPGVYSGQVTIVPQNAPARLLSYRFRVLPFALERSPSASFFYFGTRREMRTGSPVGQRWYDDPEWWRLYDTEASNLVAHGFVPLPKIDVGGGYAYGVNAIVSIGPRTNLVTLDMARAEKEFNWLRERGFLAADGYVFVPCDYGTTFCGGRSSPDRWSTNPSYSNLFCQITRAVDQQVRTKGWGTPVFEWGGELSNFRTTRFSGAVHAYGALKSCGVLTGLRGNGWVDWSLYATNRLIDFPIPNTVLMRDELTSWLAQNTKELWFYNFGSGRYAFGFFAWAKGATRRLYEGHLNLSGAPWDKFDGDHYQWQVGAEATPDGVAPLLTLEWMSEGRDDYDYLRTLEMALAQSVPSENRARGEEVLRWIREHCVTDIAYRGDPTQPGNVEEAVDWRELQPWRAMVVDAILDLQQ